MANKVRNVGALLLGVLAMASVGYGVEDTESAARWFGMATLVVLCTYWVVSAIRGHSRKVQRTVHRRTEPHGSTDDDGGATRPQDERITRDDRVAHLRGS